MSDAKETWRGKVRGMTPEEVEEFLELGVNMYLACLKPDGTPYITVCWHEWRDGVFWVIPRQHSRWAEYLANDPRVSFVVEQPKTLGKVLGSGEAELIQRPNIGGEWVPIANRMSYRDCPGEAQRSWNRFRKLHRADTQAKRPYRHQAGGRRGGMVTRTV